MTKLKKMLIVPIFMFSTLMTGCWATPEPGHVLVQTVYGKISGIVRSPGIWTVLQRGNEEWPVNITSHPTGEVWFTSGTSDRAGFKWAIKGSYHIKDDNGVIFNHVTKWGVQEEPRYRKLNEKIQTEFQAVIGNIANTYTAYNLVANTEKIREQAMPLMKSYFEKELLLELEDFQLIGKPDFFNDDIDIAPSKVVANENLKAAALAGLEADKVEQQRQEIQAQIMSNPALRDIKSKELDNQGRKYMADAIANFKGQTLIIQLPGTPSPSVQVPVR
ncbi:MAG TPA: hypothetical protein PLP33_25400 [Leptospiraceae bacterium]|nr:hypothetical protein [Leptospiraceae bacterium]